MTFITFLVLTKRCGFTWYMT